MPCKSFCRTTSPLSQSFHREILPPFLIVSLLISSAKPFWLWMYSSTYGDSDWARGDWHYCLPTCWNLLLFSGVSVLIPSDFTAAFFFFFWVSPPYLYFLPLFYFLLSIPCHSWTLSSKLSENTPLKKLLFDTSLCWWADGKVYAMEDCWSKDHHPSSLQSAHLNHLNHITWDPAPKHRSGQTTNINASRCLW